MRDTNPDESLDAEGLPDIEDRPPGITVETDQEGMVAPRDYPIAAGGDPAYPTTAAEQRTPESVADRARREIPDVGADELGVGGGVAGSERGSTGALASRGGSAGAQLIGSPGEADADPGPSTAELPDDDEAALSPEEAAMEVVDDGRI